MLKIVHATIDEEHPALAVDGGRTFSVRLSLSLEDAAGDTQEPEGAYHAFIDHLAQLAGDPPRFAAYAVNGTTPTPLDPARYEVRSDTADPALREAFKAWLEKRPALLAGTAAAGVGATEVTEEELNGFHVVMGAAGWPAPVPHQLGLVHVIVVQDLPADERLAVVPLLADARIADIQAGDDLITATFAAGGAYHQAMASISVPVATAGETLLDEESGFIRDTGQSEAFGAAVRRIEERAGSLFTGFMAATQIEWPELDTAAAADPAVPGATLRWNTIGDRFALGCLGWQAASALGTAFDTLLLALHMPGRPSRDGQLLAPFLDILVRDGLDAPADPGAARPPLEDKPAHIRHAAFRAAIRSGLREAITHLIDPIRAFALGSGKWDKFQKLIDPLLKLAGLGADQAKLLIPLVGYGATHWEHGASYPALVEALAPLVPQADPAAERTYIAQMLATELSALNDSLLGEEGMERALLALLDAAEVSEKVVAAWWGSLPAPDAAADAYKTRLAAFRDRLAQGLNGAEAARQSVGTLIADLATKDIHAGNPLEQLRKNPEIWDFWRERLQSGTFSPPSGRPEIAFAALAYPLRDLLNGIEIPTDDATGLPIHEAAIHAAVTAVGDDAARRLLPAAADRFIPDAAPGPLLVPIALDTAIDDDNSVDPFTASFAGLSLLVRRDQGRWAHACLSQLTAPESTSPTDAPADLAWPPRPVTLAPLPSGVVDNRRELFISYSGLPFSSSAYADTMAVDGEAAVPAFYLLDYPDDPGAFARLAPLAYGTRVEFAAHVVGRSGVLPPGLRDATPWLPTPDPVVAPVAASVEVSRRTAIGRVTITDARNAGRIGMQPQDLQPLSADYPRMATAPGVRIDVLRNTDGTGAIPLPKAGGPPATIRIRDVEAWPAPGATVQFEVRVGADATGDAWTRVHFGALPAGDAHAIEATFERQSEDQVEVTIRVSGQKSQPQLLAVPEGRDSVWLQLAADGGTVSFADPQPEAAGTATAGRPSPDNLLLVGTQDNPNGPWKAPFDTEPVLALTLPRMTFADFMRWTNNDALKLRALGLAKPDDKKLMAQFEALRVLLVATDMDRLNPAAPALLDGLPDLAVSAVELSAVPLDCLVAAPGAMAAAAPGVPHAGYRIPMPSLGDLLTRYGETLVVRQADGSYRTRPDAPIGAFLKKVDKALRWTITVSARTGSGLALSKHTGRPVDPEATGGDVDLEVPGGFTARLSARPVVPKALFAGTPAVLHPRLREHAIGETAQGHVFDGAHLVVEAMIGPLAAATPGKAGAGWLQGREAWAEQREKLLQHRPAGSARAYGLSLIPGAGDWRWRQVGRVTTHTQEWHFGGRPVYSWIDPRHYAPKRQPRQASLKIERPDDLFFDFEKELFVGRDDDDAQPRTIAVRPLGQETRLLDVVPDASRGATLYRHALSLRSRYIGAMALPERDGVCEAWRQTNPDRWVRIAVLEPRPAGVLTRPQLRALMPLTRRPHPTLDRQAIAPPVLALLQEKPLAFGGLAARVAAEIRTGIGYRAFPLHKTPGKDEDVLVMPADARKEIGPDPRLTYRAMDEATARRAVLAPEGPIGLTFDRDAQASAGFPNTALMLHPELAGAAAGAELEETFVSVALWRYLDPAWLIPAEDPPDLQAGDALPLDRGALWIAGGDGLQLVLRSNKPQAAPGDTGAGTPPPPIVALRVEGGRVLVNRRAVDETDFPPGAQDPPPQDLHLCDLPGDGGGLALLVHPQDTGRLAVGVMWMPGGRKPPRGTGRAPLVLAGIELSLPEEPVATLSGFTQVDLAAASGATALNWVRTNPDFSQVSLAGDAWPAEARIAIAQLSAVLEATGGNRQLSLVRPGAAKTPLWIRAGQAMRRTPSHAQRHMVALLSQTLTGIGSDMERPRLARLLPGRVLYWTPKDGLDAETAPVDQVRLVEIETPAEIIGWMPNPELVPQRYRQGYFDLASIGKAMAQGQGGLQLLFRLRFVGSSEFLAKATQINATLRFAPRGKLEMQLAELPGDSCEIFLMVGLDGAVTVTAWALDITGKLTSLAVSAQALSLADPVEALALSIDAVTAGKTLHDGEAWFETSMLAGTQSDPWAFQFDWLFGDIETDLPRLADFAAPTRLSARSEAQARVISVSPPIDVRR